MKRSNNWVRASVVVFCAAAFAGCAGTPEKPVEALTKAKTLIQQAEQNGAQQYAAADLKRARDKLDEADKAAEKGQENSRDLAVEAAADAELAAAKTRQAKAEEAVTELERSTETLRQESNRKTQPQQ